MWWVWKAESSWSPLPLLLSSLPPQSYPGSPVPEVSLRVSCLLGASVKGDGWENEGKSALLEQERDFSVDF